MTLNLGRLCPAFEQQHRVPRQACKQSLTIKVFENFNDFGPARHFGAAPT
jgi:hypothetical protein